MTRLEKGIVSETGNGQRHLSRALGQWELTTPSNEARPTDNVSVDGPRGQHEPHRYLDPEVASSLRKARLGRGWSFRTAARFTGVDAGYMCHLEHGRRVPSVVIAEALISGLKLNGFEAEQLRAVALSGVGRDFDPSRYERERE
ncbi:MAG: helix-turn-helix transcriptional regulator [Acidimicrobiales bacterium]